MIGAYFQYTLIVLNFGAAVAYLWDGNMWKGLYWLSAFMLNLCILNLK